MFVHAVHSGVWHKLKGNGKKNSGANYLEIPLVSKDCFWYLSVMMAHDHAILVNEEQATAELEAGEDQAAPINSTHDNIKLPWLNKQQLCDLSVQNKKRQWDIHQIRIFLDQGMMDYFFKSSLLSATRDFATQKIIWEGKWTGTRLHESKEIVAKTTPAPTERATEILRWSSMPGTSCRHWGTDIDLNNLTNSFFAKGEGLKMYDWLTANAANYSFCQPYSPKGAERRS